MTKTHSFRHLDLFSGIGGFALAASWVWGEQHEIVSFCEIEKFPQKVLKKHWPAVPIHDDIKTMKGDQYGRIDLVSGGFPCQPYSVAGKQLGKEDDRALWPEMLRVIKEAKPRWVIGENVAGFVNMGLDNSLSDLESEGYETTAFIIPACSINAPHRRDRVWIIANRSNSRVKSLRQEWENTIFQNPNVANSGRIGQTEQKQQAKRREQYNCNVANSKSREPRKPAKQERGEDTGRRNKETPTDTKGFYAQGFKRGQGERKFRGNNWAEPWVEAATRLCGMDARIPGRVDRLKSLGNAIVPQVVAPIMECIKLIEEQN